MSRSQPWVCVDCQTVVPWLQDRVAQRIEFVRPDGSVKYRVIRTAELCRSCAEKRADELTVRSHKELIGATHDKPVPRDVAEKISLFADSGATKGAV